MILCQKSKLENIKELWDIFKIKIKILFFISFVWRPKVMSESFPRDEFFMQNSGVQKREKKQKQSHFISKQNGKKIKDFLF